MVTSVVTVGDISTPTFGGDKKRKKPALRALESFIEKQRREGLVPKKVRVTRAGKTFEVTRWVKPEEARPTEKPSARPDVGIQDFISNKIKVTGKRKGESAGPAIKGLKAANLPESHLGNVKSIEINASKIEKVGGGTMACCNKANEIVLAGKVGHENIVHEIGHAFWNQRVYVPNKVSMIKFDVLDAFENATKTGKGFISQYASTDVEEFFAESYAAYSKDAKAFTKLNPAMGKILKDYWK